MPARPNLITRGPIASQRNIGIDPDGRAPVGPGVIEDDKLGLGVKSRARQNRFAGLLGGFSGAQGPLPDPAWEGFRQALFERGVTRLAGGESAPGSEQLRGTSVQPWYIRPDVTADPYQHAMDEQSPIRKKQLEQALKGLRGFGR